MGFFLTNHTLRLRVTGSGDMVELYEGSFHILNVLSYDDVNYDVMIVTLEKLVKK